MAGITIKIPRRLLDKFRKEAKRLFPREAAALLIGLRIGNGFHIDDLWIPEDLEQHVSENKIDWQEHWDADAHCEAAEMRLAVVGYIHSHPYRFTDSNKGRFVGCAEPAPSEGDWRHGWKGVSAICVVAEQESGGLHTRTRFYGSATPVEKVTVLK